MTSESGSRSAAGYLTSDQSGRHQRNAKLLLTVSLSPAERFLGCMSILIIVAGGGAQAVPGHLSPNLAPGVTDRRVGGSSDSWAGGPRSPALCRPATRSEPR